MVLVVRRGGFALAAGRTAVGVDPATLCLEDDEEGDGVLVVKRRVCNVCRCWIDRLL